MIRKSPMTKGRSSTMAREANRSPKTFWTARATAIPPTPRPATSAVISTPRLSSDRRSTIAHKRSFTRKLSAPNHGGGASVLLKATGLVALNDDGCGRGAPESRLDEERDDREAGQHIPPALGEIEDLRARNCSQQQNEKQLRSPQQAGDEIGPVGLRLLRDLADAANGNAQDEAKDQQVTTATASATVQACSVFP